MRSVPKWATGDPFGISILSESSYPAIQPPPIPAPGAGRHTGGMKSIYLVEDSAPVRERLTALLDAIPGAHVVGHAETAGEAVSGILAMRPDVVLCDLNLRQGTGFEVLRGLRERAPEISCYMLSNFATGPYRRLAAELGARDFFDKSTEIERMRDLIARRVAAAA